MAVGPQKGARGSRLRNREGVPLSTPFPPLFLHCIHNNSVSCCFPRRLSSPSLFSDGRRVRRRPSVRRRSAHHLRRNGLHPRNVRRWALNSVRRHRRYNRARRRSSERCASRHSSGSHGSRRRSSGSTVENNRRSSGSHGIRHSCLHSWESMAANSSGWPLANSRRSRCIRSKVNAQSAASCRAAAEKIRRSCLSSRAIPWNSNSAWCGSSSSRCHGSSLHLSLPRIPHRTIRVTPGCSMAA